MLVLAVNTLESGDQQRGGTNTLGGRETATTSHDQSHDTRKPCPPHEILGTMSNFEASLAASHQPLSTTKSTAGPLTKPPLPQPLLTQPKWRTTVARSWTCKQSRILLHRFSTVMLIILRFQLRPPQVQRHQPDHQGQGPRFRPDFHRQGRRERPRGPRREPRLRPVRLRPCHGRER